MSYKVEQLNQEFYDSAILFIETEFYKGQNIPKELLLLENDFKNGGALEIVIRLLEQLPLVKLNLNGIGDDSQFIKS